MPGKKYAKNFIQNPLIQGDDVKYRIVCQGSKYDFGGIFKNYWLRWNCITKPRSMGEPHAHDFDEIFHFLALTPATFRISRPSSRSRWVKSRKYIP